MKKYLPLLKNRPYLLLIISSLTSEIGDWAARLALTWLMYTLTGSAVAAAAVLVISTLPGATIGPWLAAKTATWKHKTATVTSDLTRTALYTIVAIHPTPATALTVAAASGIITTIFESHRSAWLPHITGIDKLGTAVGFAHALSDTTIIIGYAAGGILVGTLGVQGALWVNTITFLVSAAILAAIPNNARSTPEEETEDNPSYGLKPAWSNLTRNKHLFALIAVATIAVAAATSLEAIALPILTETGVPLETTGIILAAGAAVSLAITLKLPEQWTLHKASRWAGTLTLAAFAAAAAGFILNHPAAAAAAIIITGLCYVTIVPANVVTTIAIPTHLRTSTFAILAALLATTQAVLVIAAGTLWDTIGLTGIIAACITLAAASATYLLIAARNTPHKPLTTPENHLPAGQPEPVENMIQ